MVLSAAGATSCGGATEPETSAPARISIVAAGDTLYSSAETIDLTAVVRDSSGKTLSNVPIRWRSTSPSVATVSDAGAVTAVASGTTRIIARAGTAVDTTLIVVAQRAALLAIAPGADTLVALGDTVHLSASAVDAGGTPVVDPPVLWQSTDGDVAAVDQDGIVAALRNGTTVIIAAAGTGRDSAEVVVMQQVAGVTIAIPGATLASIGEMVTLEAVVADSGGSEIEGVMPQWASADENIARIDDGGTVTAVTNGAAGVIAAVAGFADTAHIVVEQVPALLAVGTPGGEVGNGLPISVTVTVTDALGSRVTGATTPVTLALGENPQQATISGTLDVSAVDGIASFDDVVVSRAGRSVTLAATAGALSGSSGSFDVQLRLVTISAGRGMVCGLSPTGDAYCWGRNETGGLGAGFAGDDQARPQLVAGGLTFTQLDVGAGSNVDGFHDGFACAIVPGGAAYCWGRNDFGQLGTGSNGDTMEPVLVAGGLTFSSVAAGRDHTCGLTAGAAVYCWGRNNVGQLGNGNQGVDSNVPEAIVGGLSYSAVSVGTDQGCALTVDSDLYCWVTTNSLAGSPILDEPNPVAGGVTFARVSAALSLHLCGVSAAGAGYCWGQDLGSGELGSGTQGQDEAEPALVAGGHEWVHIGAAVMFSCGLRPDGVALCWGSDNNGVLGQGTPGPAIATPAPVVGGHQFTQLAVGPDTVCGVTVSGAVYCWGSGLRGERGDGTFVLEQPTPVRVVAP